MTRFVLFALLLASGSLWPVQAQQLTEFERSRFSPAAYYNYAEPGDVTMLVNVWGSVRNPGLYEVPRNTRLSTLISLAGGPDLATNASLQANRTITIRLIRDAGGTRSTVFSTSMRNEVLIFDENPVLQEGDVLVMETILKPKIIWKDVFPIVAALGTVALAIERISR
ncbi:SLBB domain-containing protein [Rhodocaloribacter litoris]|uniref:SLBB domain-containing protein n=1 Tax=Rhodocaloribacter litoris TaxID=2558931 RepID=UPI00141EC3C0|nr:SLBB domain-containing protein [Rhodocaloribacter litoris]QXD14335.1 SLBB domain-containing protein [Rhodocaloribacter litoris]GIV60646.1 MAG: hypothetical protein KatS3mg043_1735 [Rhodothermaceae bacterium]